MPAIQGRPHPRRYPAVKISKAKLWHSIVKKFFQVNAFKTQYYLRRGLHRFSKRLPALKRIYFHAFPAVHIKPLDFYDYAMRFSSELLVVFLAMSVAGMGVYNFYLDDSQMDKSLAAKLLSYHPDLNQKLYEKNTTIVTHVVKNSGFVPLAQANDFESLGQQDFGSEVEGDQTQEEPFASDVLVQPNPDTVASLISKQIKVYKTQAGDTLASIAADNGIKVQTLMWANNLSSQTIKPGWFLVILPTDGVLHKATSNNTLPDIAKKYNGNLETIIAYNGLENAEDIDEGQLIIVPDGSMPEPPKPRSPSAGSGSGKVNSKGVVQPKIINNGTGHIFPWGYCTWYVATRVHVPWGGNAKNWLSNARAYGAVVASEPTVGAIVVTTDNSRYGHVAYIESVDDSGFTVSEMNYEKFGKVNKRWISKNSRTVRGFIYP